MRTSVLLIAASAASLASMTMADAAIKHHRSHVRHAAPVAAPVPAPPAWAAPQAPVGRSPGCFTDEGGGRFAPCNQGGGIP